MSQVPDHYPTSAFDYTLPRDRIAQHPSQRRDESRLLVLHRSDGSIEHRIFRDLKTRVSWAESRPVPLPRSCSSAP